MCKNIFGYSIKVPFPNEPNYELYLSVFNYSPPELIERQQPNSRVEVNLLRIVIYSFFEKGLVQRYLVSKDKLNSQKAVHFDHNVDIDQIANRILDNKPTLGVAHGLKLKNLLKNRASRSEYYEENKDISKLSWRNNFPATSFPKWESIEEEASIFSEGGMKFFCGGFYKYPKQLDQVWYIEQTAWYISHHSMTHDNETTTLNLDDLADRAELDLNRLEMVDCDLPYGSSIIKDYFPWRNQNKYV